MKVDVYFESGKMTRHNITLTKRIQTFEFAAETRPELIDIDSEKILLADVKDTHTEEEFIFQYLKMGQEYEDNYIFPFVVLTSITSIESHFIHS